MRPIIITKLENTVLLTATNPLVPDSLICKHVGYTEFKEIYIDMAVRQRLGGNRFWKVSVDEATHQPSWSKRSREIPAFIKECADQVLRENAKIMRHTFLTKKQIALICKKEAN